MKDDLLGVERILELMGMADIGGAEAGPPWKEQTWVVLPHAMKAQIPTLLERVRYNLVIASGHCPRDLQDRQRRYDLSLQPH